MRTISIVFAAALCVLALGCEKKKAATAAAPDCGTAVHHSMDLSKDEMKKMGTDDKMLAKMMEIGIQHCKDDKWSADAIKCMNDAQTMNDAQGCYGKLTPDQQQKMNKAAMEMASAAAPPPAAGSAEAGSAAATGSADGTAAGSAAGSAGQ